MLAVSWLNTQIVFDGIVQGLAISVIAVGVVLVYRATRIINFAVGNLGVVGATILSLLVVQYHVPYWVGFAVALVVGLAFGAIVDLAIIRRLRKSLASSSWSPPSECRNSPRRLPSRFPPRPN